jgi:hypothetical protein
MAEIMQSRGERARILFLSCYQTSGCASKDLFVSFYRFLLLSNSPCLSQKSQRFADKASANLGKTRRVEEEKDTEKL